MYLEDKTIGPAPVKPTYTLDPKGMIAWLETQDPETKFDSMSKTDCVMCRFAKAASGKDFHWDDAISLFGHSALSMWSLIRYPGGNISAMQNMTYGQVLRNCNSDQR